jgi:hypothetical protein
MTTQRFVRFLVFDGFFGLPLGWFPGIVFEDGLRAATAPMVLRLFALLLTTLLLSAGFTATVEASLRKPMGGGQFLAVVLTPAFVALFVVLLLAIGSGSAALFALVVTILVFCQHVLLVYPIVVHEHRRSRNLVHRAPEHHVGMLSALLVIAGVAPTLLLVLLGAGGAFRAGLCLWIALGLLAGVSLFGAILGYRRFFVDRFRYDGRALTFIGRAAVIVETLWQMRVAFAIYFGTTFVCGYTFLLALVRAG